MITKEDILNKRGVKPFKIEIAIDNETKRFKNVREFAAFLEVTPSRAYQIARKDQRVKKIQ